jgi:hypothetical protein
MASYEKTFAILTTKLNKRRMKTMSYCEKNMYVRETLLANPHKYGEKDKAPLREHVKECKICQASVEETRAYEEMVGRKFTL